MQEELTGIHYIPKDAKVPVEISPGFLLRLQKILVYLVTDRTPQEIQELEEHIKNNSVPEDTWMAHFITIRDLVLKTEQIAVEKKLTVLRPEEV
jgi:hypothetical protein